MMAILFFSGLKMNETRISTVTDYMFGFTELGACILGLVLNFLTLPYFNRNKKRLSSLLYLSIVIIDILILASCFPSALTMLNHRRALILHNRFFCTVTGFVFNIGSRMSVFLIAVLGCARCLSLLFPFKKPRVRVYITSVIVYLIANVVLASLPLIFSATGYHFSYLVGQCSWGINELSFVKERCLDTNCSLWLWMTKATIIFPWFIPGVVVIISAGISVASLLKSERARRSMTHRKHSAVFDPQQIASIKAKRATVTILIMTLVYSVFNVPCWMLYSYVLINEHSPTAWLYGKTALYLHIFVCRLSVAMNSATNPVIYFARIEVLSKQIFGKVLPNTYSVVSPVSKALHLVLQRAASGPSAGMVAT